MKRWPFLRTLRPGQVQADAREDIREELELYLELRAEELEREGMSAEEARRVARERFGDTTRIESDLRRQARRRHARKGTMMTMGAFRQDVAYAFRTLRRSPGFTVVAVLTLGLALGGTTSLFSVVDAALLQAMPFEDHEELVFVNGYHLTNGEIAIRGASFPEFRDWDERARGVDPMAAVGGRSLAITGDGVAESVTAAIVSEHFFRVLDVEPLRGRTFEGPEHGPQAGAAVAIISHGLWERRFGLDPAVLGSPISLNDISFDVVGIMPEGFGGVLLTTDVWVPDGALSLLGSGAIDARGARFLTVIGRLQTDADQAQAELDQIAVSLQQEYPGAHEDRFAQVEAFREGYLGDTGRMLWVLLGAGGVLLLIAAANVTNLMLVRSHGRTREIVLRRALGAEGRRVGGLLLTESIVLAAMGGLLGLIVASIGIAALGPMIPPGVLPGFVVAELDARTFVAALASLSVVAVGMGLFPAVASARLGIAQAIREGGRAIAVGGRRIRLQHVFVIAQVGLALVLLMGAGLLTRSFRAQLAVDTGSQIDRVAAVRMRLPDSRYPDADARRQFQAEAQRLASEIPGVTVASVSSDLPFRGGSSGAYVFRADAPDDRIRFHMHMVSPEYFETLGNELIDGRLLAETDRSDGPPVAVITRAMVERVFPEGDAVGRTMYLRPGGQDPFEVVGVIEDVRYRDLTTSLFAERNSPDIFFAIDQIPPATVELAVNVEGEPGAFVGPLREVVSGLDVDLPVFDLEPLRTGYERQTATPRFAAFLMTLFSVLAVVVASVGIYGVLAFSVSQRSQEIAIRRAIGASAPGVARAVFADGLRLCALGLAAGGVGAVFGSRALETLLFEVETSDPLTFAAVGSAMLITALIAAVVPALRAMRRDPAEALGRD